MGVMSCMRWRCKNIMCDLLSHKYGYICSDCFKELVNSGAETNIKEFMDTEPCRGKDEGALERYSAVFTINGE